MTRGNQRDTDRAKAQKKAAAQVRLLIYFFANLHLLQSSG